MQWLMITPEFPPQTGGLSDYTYLLGEALSRRGDEVHVWAPPCAETAPRKTEVKLHRLSGRFDLAALRQLSGELRKFQADAPLVVQYTPHGFGWRGINVLFPLWLRFRCRQPVWILFHEVAYPLSWPQAARHTVLALVQRLMARLAADAARQVFVTIPGWGQLLQRLGCRRESKVMPVFSNIPATADETAIAAVRKCLQRPGASMVIGHFSTFNDNITEMLEGVIAKLLPAETGALLLLLGRNSKAYAGRFTAKYPDLAPRIVAVGGLPPQALADHLSACDLVIAPLAGGINGRHASALASLALARPIATTTGPQTEPFWRESGAVALSPARNIDQFVSSVQKLLRTPADLPALGERARALYQERFAIERTMEILDAGRSPARVTERDTKTDTAAGA